ncbi:histidine phosphatase family protein [Pseudonocardia spinosispora]|uniref:histidine phosphatase family protein n=1 Tax=Pseudonocardia spinosispora TaxID=103441 RepID=UPI00042A1819|nr:histidine phosphatase family protein [Pseudonocardia spinosispora]
MPPVEPAATTGDAGARAAGGVVVGDSEGGTHGNGSDCAGDANRTARRPYTELTLVRHGRSVWHAGNRYAGVSDVHLDRTGHEQAARLAEWAARHPHDAVICSPLRRSADTAAPIAEALGMPAEVEPDLREMDFGEAEGYTLAELRVRSPLAAAAFVTDPVHYAFPGSEHPKAVAERVQGVLRRLARRYPGGSVLVVGHNTALRLALCGWLGIPLRHYRHVLPKLDNASVTKLRVFPDPALPPALLCLNAAIGVAPPEPIENSVATAEQSVTS